MKKFIPAFIFLLLLSSASISPVSALNIVVRVPEKYTDVQAGERFYFEIEIKYPENPARKDLRLNYEILRDGTAIAQSQVLKAVETQASFVDFIVIPESTETGLHTINIRISDYGDLSREVSASFHVTRESNMLETYFLVLIGVTLLVAALVAINLVTRIRRTRKR